MSKDRIEVFILIKKSENCYKFVFLIDVAPSRIKFLNLGNSLVNYTYSNNYPIKISNRIHLKHLRKLYPQKKNLKICLKNVLN